MCTVTYLPLPNGGYLLGTNRDESHQRGPAHSPTVRVLGGRQVLAPTDSDAGGTWVGLDDQGATLCVLNGDRRPRGKLPAELRSRGLLVLDLLGDAGVDPVTTQLMSWAMTKELPYRPFKLLSIEQGETRRARLHEWDGREFTMKQLTSPTVVISSTFDTDAVSARRQKSFERFVAGLPEGDGADWPSLLASWHCGHRPGCDEGDAFSICMHRSDAHTVSHAQVQVWPGHLAMAYQPGQPCEEAPLELSSLPSATAC
ncbi:MAG: hypothetical protein ACI9EF_001046 [Pseudohongiellaceae bacterium]|jgi:hypothetical protein